MQKVFLFSFVFVMMLFFMTTSVNAFWFNLSQPYCRNITVTPNFTTTNYNSLIIMNNTANINMNGGGTLQVINLPCGVTGEVPAGNYSVKYKISKNATNDLEFWILQPNVTSGVTYNFSVYYGNSTTGFGDNSTVPVWAEFDDSSQLTNFFTQSSSGSCSIAVNAANSFLNISGQTTLADTCWIYRNITADVGKLYTLEVSEASTGDVAGTDWDTSGFWIMPQNATPTAGGGVTPRFFYTEQQAAGNNFYSLLRDNVSGSGQGEYWNSTSNIWQNQAQSFKMNMTYGTYKNWSIALNTTHVTWSLVGVGTTTGQTGINFNQWFATGDNQWLTIGDKVTPFRSAFFKIDYVHLAHGTANSSAILVGSEQNQNIMSISVAISSPIANQLYNSSNLSLNYVVTPSGGAVVSSCGYSLNGAANVTLSTCQNTTFIASEGGNNISVTAQDTNNTNYTSTVLNFMVDTISPSVAIQLPPNNASYNTTTVPLNYTASDTNRDSCKYELNGVNYTLTACANTTMTAPSGQNIVKVYVNDTVNYTSVANSSFFVDITIPTISISSPINKTYNVTSIPLNYTAFDPISTVMCNIEFNGVNTSSPTCTNTTLTAIQGNNYVKIWVNDTVNNINTSRVSFFVDSISPSLSIQLPTNTTYNTTSIPLNYTASDTNINTCTREFNGVNDTLSNCGNVTLTAIQGSNTVKVFVNDTANNTVMASVSFFVDSIYPQINLISPVNNFIYNYTPVAVTYTFIEANVNTCIYELDGVNTTLPNCINTTIGPVNGTHIFKLYITDVAGNRNSTTINFTIDTTIPIVDITSPTDGGSYAVTNITLNYTATDPVLGVITGCKYELNGVNTTLPSSCPNTTFIAVQGTNTIKVWANDSANNYGFHMHTFSVDSISPSVAIQAPSNTTYISLHSVDLNFTASDLHLSTCQYSFDGGGTVSLPGCANTTLSIPSLGPHNVNVSATDTYGNIGSAKVFFTVTNTAPTVAIQSPLNTTYYTNLTFNLRYTASGTGDLDTCYYNVSGGTVNNTVLSLCGNTTFSVPGSGQYNLTLFVNDTWNNATITSVSFTDFQGVNLSVLLPNGSANAVWNVIATNGTNTTTFTGLNNPALIISTSLPQGIVNFTATDNNFDNESWYNITINNTMGVVQHSFTLYPITNVTFYDTQNSVAIQNWLLTISISNGTVLFNSTVASSYSLSNRILLNGWSTTFNGQKNTYRIGTTNVNPLSTSVPYNLTITTVPTNQIIYALDEITPATKVGFNAELVLKATNTTVAYVTGYRTGNSCWYDNNPNSACIDQTWSCGNPCTDPITTTQDWTVQGFDRNIGTFQLIYNDTSSGSPCSAGINVYMNKTSDGSPVSVFSHSFGTGHNEGYQVQTFTVDNTQGTYARASNMTIVLTKNVGQNCGPTRMQINELRLVSPYTYVDNTTITYPTALLGNYTTYDIYFRGEETYAPLYTQKRMLQISLDNTLSDFNVVGYLLKDSLGYNQLFTVLDPNNVPISGALLTLGKWYSNVLNTVAQCESNPAGSCSIFLAANDPLYSLTSQKSGYNTNYTANVMFTGSPNPAYVYMKSGSAIVFTDVFANLQVAIAPSDDYLQPNATVPAQCIIAAGEGNINYMNFTVTRWENGTASTYNSTQLNNVPTGATIQTLISDNGRYDLRCSYQWVSNASGNVMTYTNFNQHTIWIYSDYLANQGTALFGQPLAMILAIGVTIIIAGGIALYNTGYGVTAGILLLAAFAYMGFLGPTGWYMFALGALGAIALLVLRNAI